MKIRPVGAEFHADRRTDMTKIIDFFAILRKGPINDIYLVVLTVSLLHNNETTLERKYLLLADPSV